MSCIDKFHRKNPMLCFTAFQRCGHTNGYQCSIDIGPIFLPNLIWRMEIDEKEVLTPSIPEIIWAKNVRAIVVCGFIMK